MVDVSAKPISLRMARASGVVVLQPETLRLIRDRQVAKGNVYEVARLAGIMAAKQTDHLIPLCHTLPLSSVEIAFEPLDARRLRISAVVTTSAQTGVEMEALTAVTVAALTVYDMCKAVDRELTITEVQLEEKLGGRSGHYVRGESSKHVDADHRTADHE